MMYSSAARPRLRSGLVVLPLGVLIGLFFLVPISLIIWDSFFGTALNFSKYRDAILDPINYRVLSHTLTIALLVTAVSILIAYPVALYLTKLRPVLLSIAVSIILIPLFTAFLIRTYAWIIILGRQGIVNNLLMSLGIIHQPLQILNTSTAVVIGMAHVFIPTAIFTIYAGMTRIDPVLSRAALALGAHPTKAFTRVYFPLTLPSVLSASVLIFIAALGFYITPALLGGPADTMISQLVIVQMTTLLDFEMGFALAGILLFITMLALLIASVLVPLEVIWTTDAQVEPQRLMESRLFQNLKVTFHPILALCEDAFEWLVSPLRAASIPWGGFFCVVALTYLAAPLFVVVILSFSSSQFVIFPPPGFSIQWWVKLYQAADWHAAFFSSLWLGAVVCAIATIIGGMGAFWLVRSSFPYKRLLFVLVLSPLIVPTIVTATALYVFEARVKLLGSFLGLATGHLLLATPYVVIIMSAALRGFDRNLERAAVIHGANIFQTLSRVTIPLLAPAIVTSMLIAFLTSFDELLITIFLIGRQPPTLPLKFWGDIKYQIDPLLSAASTLIVVLTAIGVALVQLGRTRRTV